MISSVLYAKIEQRIAPIIFDLHIANNQIEGTLYFDFKYDCMFTPSEGEMIIYGVTSEKEIFDKPIHLKKSNLINGRVNIVIEIPSQNIKTPTGSGAFTSLEDLIEYAVAPGEYYKIQLRLKIGDQYCYSNYGIAKCILSGSYGFKALRKFNWGDSYYDLNGRFLATYASDDYDNFLNFYRYQITDKDSGRMLYDSDFLSVPDWSLEKNPMVFDAGLHLLSPKNEFDDAYFDRSLSENNIAWWNKNLIDKRTGKLALKHADLLGLDNLDAIYNFKNIRFVHDENKNQNWYRRFSGNYAIGLPLKHFLVEGQNNYTVEFRGRNLVKDWPKIETGNPSEETPWPVKGILLNSQAPVISSTTMKYYGYRYPGQEDKYSKYFSQDSSLYVENEAETTTRATVSIIQGENEMPTLKQKIGNATPEIADIPFAFDSHEIFNLSKAQKLRNFSKPHFFNLGSIKFAEKSKEYFYNITFTISDPGNNLKNALQTLLLNKKISIIFSSSEIEEADCFDFSFHDPFNESTNQTYFCIEKNNKQFYQTYFFNQSTQNQNIIYNYKEDNNFDKEYFKGSWDQSNSNKIILNFQNLIILNNLNKLYCYLFINGNISDNINDIINNSDIDIAMNAQTLHSLTKINDIDDIGISQIHNLQNKINIDYTSLASQNKLIRDTLNNSNYYPIVGSKETETEIDWYIYLGKTQTENIDPLISFYIKYIKILPIKFLICQGISPIENLKVSSFNNSENDSYVRTEDLFFKSDNLQLMFDNTLTNFSEMYVTRTTGPKNYERPVDSEENYIGDVHPSSNSYPIDTLYQVIDFTGNKKYDRAFFDQTFLNPERNLNHSYQYKPNGDFYFFISVKQSTINLFKKSLTDTITFINSIPTSILQLFNKESEKILNDKKINDSQKPSSLQEAFSKLIKENFNSISNQISNIPIFI